MKLLVEISFGEKWTDWRIKNSMWLLYLAPWCESKQDYLECPIKLLCGYCFALEYEYCQAIKVLPHEDGYKY